MRDGSSVWADHYEAKTEDLFDVEGQIGERVAAALEIALGARERKTIAARPTENFEAYSYFLRGEALRTAEEDASTTRRVPFEMFERAVALDPKFALAFARLAKTHADIYWANTDRTAKRLALVRTAAETAVRLDPELPEAHIALGYYYFWGLRDFGRALAELSAAAERQPGNGEIFSTRGAILRRSGRLAEAVANLERALELDPRTPQLAFNIAEHPRRNAPLFRRRSLSRPDARAQPAMGRHLRGPRHVHVERDRRREGGPAFPAGRNGVA